MICFACYAMQHPCQEHGGYYPNHERIAELKRTAINAYREVQNAQFVCASISNVQTREALDKIIADKSRVFTAAMLELQRQGVPFSPY